ncbi:MAG: hypothetical protein PHQ40_12695 [Anaerolineaceae bacterium]|nr:hypothetical protein [Anaerolineaceae bacterium]
MISTRIVPFLTILLLSGCIPAQAPVATIIPTPQDWGTQQVATPEGTLVGEQGCLPGRLTCASATLTPPPSPNAWDVRLTKTTLTPIPSATEEAPTPVSIPSYSHRFPSGLVVEEYELKAAPQMEPLTFDPVQGSQASILEKHRVERERYFYRRSIYSPEMLIYPATGEGQYLAKQVSADVDGRMKVSVEVLKDGKVIFTAPAGDISPLDAVRGLWVSAGHWVIEYADVTSTKANALESRLTKVGQVVQDGVLINQRDGVQEVFGFQLLKDQPFYFYKKSDQIKVAYAGENYPIGYDDIPHYGCCSSAALNPIQAKNMVAFFARRNTTWYYVEMGRYD